MPGTVPTISGAPGGGDAVLAAASFDVTPADVTAAQLLAARWLVLRPRTFVVPAVLALAAGAFIAATTPDMGVRQVGVEVGIVFGVLLAVRALALAVLPLMGGYLYRQQPNLRHRWRVELSEAGLRAVTPNQDAFVAWADYVGWSESRRVLLVYQSDRLFQFIPARALDRTFLDVFHRLVASLPRR